MKSPYSRLIDDGCKISERIKNKRIMYETKKSYFKPNNKSIKKERERKLINEIIMLKHEIMNEIDSLNHCIHSASLEKKESKNKFKIYLLKNKFKKHKDSDENRDCITYTFKKPDDNYEGEEEDILEYFERDRGYEFIRNPSVEMIEKAIINDYGLWNGQDSEFKDLFD